MAYTVYYDTPGTFLTPAQYLTAMDGLVAANPSWSLVTVGYSEQGRAVKGVVINGTGYESTALITGGIHGNETWAARSVFDLLNYLSGKTLFPTIRMLIIPNVNPDGLEGETRKNNNSSPATDDSLTPWPRAVDLNRNFPTGWGGGSSSTDPADINYCGPSAASEIETQNMISVVSTYAPKWHVDAHTKLDQMYPGTGLNSSARSGVVDAALTANDFTPYPWVSGDLSGMFASYTNAQGAESYIAELKVTYSTIHEEANRFICAMLAFLTDWVRKGNNDFSADSTCVAYYKFEGDITADSKGSNTLTNTGAILSAYRAEGWQSAYFNRSTSARMSRTDANLSSDFPGKSGTSNTDLGLALWFRVLTQPATGVSYLLVGKRDTGGNARSWAIGYNNTGGVYTVRFYLGYNGGASEEIVTLYTGAALTTGAQYAVIGGHRASDKKCYWIVAQEGVGVLATTDVTTTNSMSVDNAIFGLGCSFASGSPVNNHNGNLDAVAVFNALPDTTKISSILAGTYGASSALTGTLAATLADSTSSAAGSVAIAGASSSTLAISTASSTGSVLVSGTLSQTLASATLSVSTSSGLSAAMSSTLADASCASTGTAAIAGSLAAPLATSTIASSGAVAVSGALASTLADSTLSSGSSTAAVGALASTLQSATVSASGAVSVSGSLSATLADATLSAYFGDSTPAQLAVTLASATMAATGEVAVMAALSAALQDAFAASAGEVDIDAECAAILADCFGAISGSVSIVGSGSATLAGATLSARAGANLVPAALPNRISRVARENRIVRA